MPFMPRKRNISAIGFKTMEKRRKDMSEIIRRVTVVPDNSFSHKNSVEQYGFMGDDYGFIVYGTRLENGEVKVRRWNAFAMSDATMCVSDVDFERHGGGDVYAYCEDTRTGQEFEFRLNNVTEFNDYVRRTGNRWLDEAEVNIAGLCETGSVLFPISRDGEYFKRREEELEAQFNLVQRFKNGELAAGHKLREQARARAENVRERLKTEDVLSVFEGYLLPYGESDSVFALLGDIVSVKKSANRITQELIYSLGLDVTGITINVLINACDIVGAPAEGMRFMGVCSLQGSVNFSRRI
jgi:hypothetical protein